MRGDTRRAVVAGTVCVDLTPGLATLPPSSPGALAQVGPLVLPTRTATAFNRLVEL